MTMLTAREWSARGYRIRTGAHSFARAAGGIPLFSHYQVTPWDYVPAYRSKTPAYVTVDGQLYRKV